MYQWTDHFSEHNNSIKINKNKTEYLYKLTLTLKNQLVFPFLAPQYFSYSSKAESSEASESPSSKI